MLSMQPLCGTLSLLLTYEALGSGLKSKSVCRISEVFQGIAVRHSQRCFQGCRRFKKGGLPSCIIPCNTGAAWKLKCTGVTFS